MNEKMKNRINALNKLMDEHELDAVLLLTPGMGNTDLWLLAEDHVPTPAPFNRNSAFLVFKGEDEVIKLCQTTTHPTDRAQYVHFEDADIDGRLAGCRVGVVHPETMKKNVADFTRGITPAVTLKDITFAFEEIKAVKTESDLVAMRRAAAAYDKLFTAMPLILRTGRLEAEVVNEIRQRASDLGAESETPGFHTMVWLTSAPAGGPSAPEPIKWPGRRLAEGDRINVIVRGYIGGCGAELARTFILGSASDAGCAADAGSALRSSDIGDSPDAAAVTAEAAASAADWDLAVRAQLLAASLAVPGAAPRAIAGAVNDFLKNNGSLEDQTGWIHGLGTSVYESPVNIGAAADMKLQEGMVLAIGPSVRHEGCDPFTCSDAFVVREGGAVRLSKTSHEMRLV